MSPTLTRATMIRVGELVGASAIVYRRSEARRSIDRPRAPAAARSGAATPDVTNSGTLADIFALFERTATDLAKTAGPADRRATRTERRDAVSGIRELRQGARRADARRPAEVPRERAEAGAARPASARGALERLRGPGTEREGPVGGERRREGLAALAQGAIPHGALAHRPEPARRRRRAAHGARIASDPRPCSRTRSGSSSSKRTPAAPAAAVPYFTRAVAGEASNTDYLFNLGYARALAQDPAGALNGLREAVRFDAANGDAHLVMSAVLASAGKTVEAQRELDLAKQLGTRPDSSPLAVSARIPPSLERLRTDLDMPPAARGDPALANPAQRDQQETAAFHLDQGQRAVQRAARPRSHERVAARDLSRPVRGRPARAARQDLPARRTAQRSDRRIQGGDLVPRFRGRARGAWRARSSTRVTGTPRAARSTGRWRSIQIRRTPRRC